MGECSDLSNEPFYTTGQCDTKQCRDRAELLINEMEKSWFEFEPMSGTKGNVHFWSESCKVLMKEYRNIKDNDLNVKSEWGDGSGGALIYNVYKNRVYLISNGIWKKYKEHSGPCGGTLGLPIDTWGVNSQYENTYREQQAAVKESNKGEITSSALQRFENGSIYWHWNSQQNTAYNAAVWGSIWNRYEAMSGTTSSLGFPYGDATLLRGNTCGYNVKGYRGIFDEGRIYSSPVSNEVLEIPYGKILNRYINEEGEVEGNLGWPKSRLHFHPPAAATKVEFQKGGIYNSLGVTRVATNNSCNDKGIQETFEKKAEIEQKYGIKMTDGDVEWTLEELNLTDIALSKVPEFIYSGYLKEIIRNKVHPKNNSATGYTQTGHIGFTNIEIYNNANRPDVFSNKDENFQYVVIHELMHVYQFKYGGGKGNSFKYPESNTTVSKFYKQYYYVLKESNEYRYNGPDAHSDFVSAYANSKARGLWGSEPYEELADVMTFYIIKPNQFYFFDQYIDKPDILYDEYHGMPKNSEKLQQQYLFLKDNIYYKEFKWKKFRFQLGYY